MFKERYLKVKGLKVRYFDEGEGPIVLLIHGLGGSAVNWFKNIGPLSQKYRVIAVDLPSFGKSEIPKRPPENISYDYFSQFLKDFLSKLKIKRVTLVGNSMGGGTAISFTFKFSKMVDKLVIVAGAGLGREISLYKLLICPFSVRTLSRVLSCKTLSNRLAKLVVYDLETLDEASVSAYVDWLKNANVQDVLAKMGPRAVDLGGQKRLFVESLPKISRPTLIIWGRNDRVLPFKQGLRAHELIKKSKLVIFNHCGHVPQLERPKEFNKVLLKFLAKTK